jgi:WD40 repeat protein
VPWTAFALLLASSAAFAIFRLRLSRTSAAFTLAAPVRWAANGSDNPVGTAAISPDGQTLAFTDADGLLIQKRHDVAPTLQPALDLSEIDHLSWFPDGKHIAVSGVAKRGAASEVWSIAADGISKPSLLRDDIRSATVSPITGNIAYLNNDGTEVWEANSDGSGARLLRSADPGSVFDQILWTFGKPTLLVEQVRLPSRKELEANPNAVPSPQESTLIALNNQNGAVTSSGHGFKFTEGCSLPGARLMLEGLDEHQHSIPVSATFNPDLPGLFESPPERYSPPNAAVVVSCREIWQTATSNSCIHIHLPPVNTDPIRTRGRLTVNRCSTSRGTANGTCFSSKSIVTIRSL